jgi:hypothetical protein
MWLDGCYSQFKSKTPWFFVNHYPFLTRGCTLLWSFFGIGHGKRPHDGAKIVLKRFIKQAAPNCKEDVVELQR